MRHIESNLQAACVRWARLQFSRCSRLLFSVPNGAHLSLMQAKILKAEGLVAGVADMLLLCPSADGMYAGLCIEFKTKAGRQSENQKAWQRAVEAAGPYRYVVVRSFEQFKTLITHYLNDS